MLSDYDNPVSKTLFRRCCLKFVLFTGAGSCFLTKCDAVDLLNYSTIRVFIFKRGVNASKMEYFSIYS